MKAGWARFAKGVNVMQATESVFARDDTFFGVCQAIGDDFGFSPNWLRAALGVGLIWNPMLMVGLYAGAGVIVLFARLVVREPRIAASDQAVAVAADQAAPASCQDDEAREPLPVAA